MAILDDTSTMAILHDTGTDYQGDDVSNYSSYSYSYGDGCADWSRLVVLANMYVVPLSEKMLRFGVLPIIVIVGLSLNLCFLLAVARVQYMRTSLNCYLVNLACADIMILSTNFVDKVVRCLVNPVYGAASFGVEGCVLITVFKWWGFFTSLTLITVITLEKFYAVCHPLTHKRLNHKKRRITMCSAAWFFSLVAACVEIPTVIKMDTRCISKWPPGDTFDRFPSIIKRCYPITLPYVKFCQVYTAIPFFISMIINVCLYICIYLAVRKTTKWHKQRNDTGANRADNTHRVARMLITNGMVFFICLAPNQALLLVDALGAAPTSQQYETFIQTAAVLIYLNSCMNPLVYCLTNPRYRLAYRLAFKCTTKYRDGFAAVRVTKDRFNSSDSMRTRSTSMSMNRLPDKWMPMTTGVITTSVTPLHIHDNQ